MDVILAVETIGLTQRSHFLAFKVMIQIPKNVKFSKSVFWRLHLWKRFAAFDHVRLTTHFVKLGHICVTLCVL